MIPVVFFPGWSDESVSVYTQRLAYQTPDNSARWKRIYATADISEAKYAICQDNRISIHLARQAGFEPSQIIYIKREADSSLPPLDTSSVLLAYQGASNIIPAVWSLSIPFNDLCSLRLPEKQRACSAIISSCENLPGHRSRLTFINALASVIDIDVFGRGHLSKSFSNKYIGELTDPAGCKRNGFLRYSYSVCIESIQENGYITEKFNDSLLCFAVPIYHGAPNIHIYYPSHSFCKLDSIIDGFALNIAIEFIDESPSSENLLAMCQARELLLFKYNIWNIVNSLVRHVHF